MMDTLDRGIAKTFFEYYVVFTMYTVFRRVLRMSSPLNYIFLILLLGVFAVRNIEMLAHIFKKNAVIYLVVMSIQMVLFLVSLGIGNLLPSVFFRYYIQEGIVCCPLLLIGYSIEDKQIFYEYIVEKGMLLIVLASFIVIRNDGSYVMTLGYHLLLPILVYINQYLKTWKAKYLLYVIWGSGLLILYCSRGPLLAIAVFVLLRISIGRLHPALKLFFYGIIVAIGVAWVRYSVAFYEWLVAHGINSRTLRLILTDISYNSGRTDIITKVRVLLRANSGRGYGIASDSSLIGGYPHNIFWELLFDYGYFLGIVLFAFLIIALVIFIFSKGRNVNLIFVCLGFVPLFLSGTYLTEPPFWFLIGMMLKGYKRGRICIEKRK